LGRVTATILLKGNSKIVLALNSSKNIEAIKENFEAMNVGFKKV